MDRGVGGERCGRESAPPIAFGGGHGKAQAVRWGACGHCVIAAVAARLYAGGARPPLFTAPPERLPPLPRLACIAALVLTAGLAAPPFAAAQEEIVFSADQVSVDPETGEIVARGEVVMLHEGYRLEAGLVRYDDRTGVAEAERGVTLIDPDGTVLNAARVRLTDGLARGMIENARLILSDGSRVAAASGERGVEKSRLDKAVYSPCPVCDDRPEEAPVWQLKAVEVVHDEAGRRLIYRNAFLELFGVPVAWLPYLSHPDPSVERASGFLEPEVFTRDELGVVVELPYHWAVSPSQDVTLTPIVATKVAPALAVNYRHHVGYGRYDLEGSVTHTGQPSEAVTGRDDDGLRGHIFSGGRFRHGDNWRSTYQAQWSSDDTYVRLYDFSDADTLVSDYRLEGFYGRSYIGGELLGFQGLRQEDGGGLTAHALPWIGAAYVSEPGFLGGTVEARLGALSLLRTGGADTRRLSASAQWQAPLTTASGLQLVFDAFVRGDLYEVSEASRLVEPEFAGRSGTELRGLARASATLSWPFVSHAGGVRQIVEPVLQLAAIPEGANDPAIPNEDSRAVELSAANLFSLNRAPGFDIWESGSRATYGLRYRLAAGDVMVSALAGQSIRVNDLPGVFPEGTGLSDSLSDLVGRLDLSWRDWVDLIYQLQLDPDGLDSRRHEAAAIIGNDRLSLDAGYLKIDRGLNILDRGDREEMRLAARAGITNNWTVFGGTIQDLSRGADPIEWEAGLVYKNECLELGVTVRERFTRDRDIEPGTQVIFRIRLLNLG